MRAKGSHRRAGWLKKHKKRRFLARQRFYQLQWSDFGRNVNRQWEYLKTTTISPASPSRIVFVERITADYGDGPEVIYSRPSDMVFGPPINISQAERAILADLHRQHATTEEEHAFGGMPPDLKTAQREEWTRARRRIPLDELKGLLGQENGQK